MNDLSITVCIKNSSENLKIFEENYDNSPKSFINALNKIKETTNNYLTNLVNEEKYGIDLKGTKSSKQNDAGSMIVDDIYENDIHLEEDYVDSEIKKELLGNQKISLGFDNKCKTERRVYKRVKHK